MHYEGPLLEASLQRQMANFNHIPPPMAIPFGSYVFFKSIPNIFMPPPMYDVNQGGHNLFMEQSIRTNTHDSPSQGSTQPSHAFASASLQGSPQTFVPSSATPPI